MLQGHYSSLHPKKQQQQHKRSASAKAPVPSFSSIPPGSYFVSESGKVTGNGDTNSSIFIAQLGAIAEALGIFSIFLIAWWSSIFT